MAHSVRIPACEAQGVHVNAGSSFRVIDVEGGQVCDLWAFVADDPSEWHAAECTRAAARRLFPALGESFVTNRRRPILTLVADHSPGTHDMLIAACDPQRYAQYGVEHPHPSCAENLSKVLAEHDVKVEQVPQPINLFMNTQPTPDGRIVNEPAVTRPGDSVTLRAELDALVVVSACPFDVFPISSGGLTDLAIELSD
jgi:uncharacterized protein YcgI (DUF1989 family)